MIMQTVLEFIASLSGALFAGAALYINVAEHPARMLCDTKAAMEQWAPSYARATRMQAPLAVVGCLSAILAWLAGAGVDWLIGGVMLGLVVPFTLLVIMPTNQRLLSANLDKGSAQARELLVRWNRLHGVRTVLSMTALVLFLLGR